MLPDGRRLGAHLPLGGGMVKAVERAHEIGATAMQIFTDNPTAWRRRATPPKERDAFVERAAVHDLAPIVIHAAYLVNLAGPEPDFFERSIDVLAVELAGASTFGAQFVNVHIGSHRDTGVAAGTNRVADGVSRSLALADARAAAADADAAADATPGTAPGTAPQVRLVLENSAGSGWGLGVDVDELAGIAAAIRDRGVPDERIGFCLDAAHAWAAGIDLASPSATDAFLTDFDARIGLDRLVLVHLNDSRTERGSRVDRHEHVGAGRIGEVGMRHLIRHPRLGHVTYLLETPGMDEGYDAVNVARALALARGETLEALPPAAFDLRPSDRSRTPPA
jgi:deoxyribonuclease-4